MKKILTLLAAVLFLTFGCSKDKDESPKGLVSFKVGPMYVNETIIFTAQIQFPNVGTEVNIEYQVLDGDDVLLSETLSTQNSDGGIGFFFDTPTVTIQLDPLEDFSGKDLTIWLDPDNKVTSGEYTSEEQVNQKKKKTVTIP